MLEVFDLIELEFDGSKGEVVDFYQEDMMRREMVIENPRPSYPSNKLTFNIADETKEKVIKFFSIFLNLNEQFDVNVVLEDSKRSLMNSFEK